MRPERIAVDPSITDWGDWDDGDDGEEQRRSPTEAQEDASPDEWQHDFRSYREDPE